MKLRLLLPLAAATTLLGACVYIDAEDGGRYHIETQFGLPDLRAVDIGDDAVTIRMSSNGCTNKETVDASVDQDGRNEYEIAFDRIREDNCRAYFPNGVEMSWSYKELGIPSGAYVRVLNDIAS